MTPHTAEMLQLVVPLLVAALGGPPAIKRGLSWWAAYKERRAAAKEQIALTSVERDVRTEDRLWERLDRVEAHVEECEQGRKLDREECDRRMARLESKVELRTSDLTGKFRTIAQHEVKRASRTNIPAGGEDPNK